MLEKIHWSHWLSFNRQASSFIHVKCHQCNVLDANYCLHIIIQLQILNITQLLYNHDKYYMDLLS